MIRVWAKLWMVWSHFESVVDRICDNNSRRKEEKSEVLGGKL